MAAKGRKPAPPCAAAPDHVDRLRAQWARELPAVDTEGMAVLGRARRLTLMLRRDIEAVFERHDLDAGEFDVLATLRRAGAPFELRPTELYRSLMVSSGGLTARLDRLEQAGLVRRAPSSEDGRSLRVRLTEKGRQRIEAAFREDMALESKALEALDGGERAELARLLRKLTLALEPAPGDEPKLGPAVHATGGKRAAVRCTRVPPADSRWVGAAVVVTPARQGVERLTPPCRSGRGSTR